MNTVENWKEIWEKKGVVNTTQLTMPDLIAIDGFDTGAGKFSLEKWLKFAEYVKNKLGIQVNNKLCEIGCGGGAFLMPFAQKGVQVYGIDYAKNLISICQDVIPNGVFKMAEANKIPFPSNTFNGVMSNSVFHYFPNLSYAELVIKEMVRILQLGGKGAILDINDQSKKIAFLQLRGKKMGIEKYNQLYKDTPHAFYDKKWIAEIFKNNNCQCEIVNQSIDGYENSTFRFNVFFEKKG